MLGYFSDIISAHIGLLPPVSLSFPKPPKLGAHKQRTPIEEVWDPKVEIDFQTLYGLAQV